ncbi:unnamed protein product [Bemisia tabaci]|uniref:Cytochrome b561 domain-containing protein n=1 Tax=Bemisia tabaci TaxID=7038 RepID=A0A9P0G2F5_BEMTA|nr:unnamed protein product [Bemisia tabaci]
MNFPKYRVHFNNRSDCSDESESDDSDDSDSDSSCSGVSSAPSNFCCPVKPPRSRSNSRSKCECKCFAEPTKSDTSKNICPSCRDGSKSSLRCSSKPILKETKSDKCCSERPNRPSTVKFDLDPPDIDFCAEEKPKKRKKSKERCVVASPCQVPMGRMRRREDRHVDEDCNDDCDWVDINRPEPEECPKWTPPRKRWSSEDIFTLCKLLAHDEEDAYLGGKMRDLLRYRGSSDGRIYNDRLYNAAGRQQSAASRIRSSVGDLPLREPTAKEKLLLKAHCIPPRQMSLSSMSRYGNRGRTLNDDKFFIPYAIPRDKTMFRTCPETMCQPGFQMIPTCDRRPLKSKCTKRLFRFRFPLRSHCKGKRPKIKYRYEKDGEDDWVQRSEDEDPHILPPTSVRQDRIKGAFRSFEKLRGGGCDDDVSLASFAPTAPSCPPISTLQDCGPPPPQPPPAVPQRTCSPNSQRERSPSRCTPPPKSARHYSPPSRRCTPPPSLPPQNCPPAQSYRAYSPQSQSPSAPYNYAPSSPSRTRLQMVCQPAPEECESFELAPGQNYSMQCNPIKNPCPQRLYKAEIMPCPSAPQCQQCQSTTSTICSVCGPMKVNETSPKNCSFVEFFSKNRQRCEQCNKGCSILSALLHSFIILMLAGTTVLVFIWAFYFRKTVGFSATDAQANINYHPVMMISGFISLSGFSLLIYRLGQCCRHGYMQCIHLALHGLAVPCIVLGISAAFNYHKLVKPAEHHLITLHSWIGLITIILFAVQFTGGVLSFVLTNCCSGMAQRIREGFIPIHATLGMTTLLMAISTALTGLTQRILYVSQKDPKATAGTGYRGMEAYFQARIGEYSEAMIVNLLGGFLLILAVLMPISLRRKCPKPMMTCVNGCSAC